MIESVMTDRGVHSLSLRRLRSMALLIAMALALACLCWAQAAASGTVNGTVTSASGSPVVGVKVVMVSVSSFSPTTLSDEKGNFTFPGLPLGAVTVTVLGPKAEVLGRASGTLSIPNQVLLLPVTIP